MSDRLAQPYVQLVVSPHRKLASLQIHEMNFFSVEVLHTWAEPCRDDSAAPGPSVI